MTNQVACDACGADEGRVLFHAFDYNYGYAGQFAIVRCRRCGLVYVNPRPGDDELICYYPDQDYHCFRYGAPASPLAPAHHFMRATARANITRGRVCDIGCGSGQFLASAKASGWHVTGIELNEYARHLCQQVLPEANFFRSLTDADFPTNDFDAVTMWHVLEHLPSPMVTLRQINRILRPGGILGVAVPNFGSLERKVWGKRWIQIAAPIHLYHFEMVTLVRHLENAGFQVVEVLQAPGEISLAANILRTLRNALLDPYYRRRSVVTQESHSQTDSTTTPERNTPGFPVSDVTKARSLQITSRLVYPWSWLNARLGYGPELLVYANKPS